MDDGSGGDGDGEGGGAALTNTDAVLLVHAYTTGCNTLAALANTGRVALPGARGGRRIRGLGVRDRGERKGEREREKDISDRYSAKSAAGAGGERGGRGGVGWLLLLLRIYGRSIARSGPEAAITHAPHGGPRSGIFESMLCAGWREWEDEGGRRRRRRRRWEGVFFLAALFALQVKYKRVYSVGRKEETKEGGGRGETDEKLRESAMTAADEEKGMGERMGRFHL